MTEDRFALELPPSAAYLGTARAFVGALGRHLCRDHELVSDLELAVSEACSDALDRDVPIRVRARATGDVLELEIGAPPASAAVPGLEGLRRIEVIRSLFPDAVFAGGDGDRVIRLSIPT